MMKKMVMKKLMVKKMTQTTVMKMQCQPEAQAAVAAAQLQQQKQKQQQAAAAAASIVVHTVKKIVQMHLDYRATYDTPQLVKQQQTETNRYV